jgi:RNA polymerase sigma-70 factor (ECF subfamily)
MSQVLTDNETELVTQLQTGDEAAYAELYDRYSAMLYGIISRIVGDEEDAANLLQDCFVKIWRNIGAFDPTKGRFATWLINVARNTAIDFTRSKYFSQKRKNQNLDFLVGSETARSVAYFAEDTLGLRQLVDKLTPVCRQVIEWMYFDGFTQQEIADKFGIPLGTVKSRTRLALKELRSYFCEN